MNTENGKQVPDSDSDGNPIPISIPVIQNQLIILEIHKGHPLKREIFVNSISGSKTIKDLKICFEWDTGPQQHLEQLLIENTSIRKLQLLITEYDNDYSLIDYIRLNRWIKEAHFDIFFADNFKIKENAQGYQIPYDPVACEHIPSISRIETLELHHGVKTNKARNDVLASFPP